MKSLINLFLTFTLLVTPAADIQRVSQQPCLKCNNGVLSLTTNRHYEHAERFSCTHGKRGYDEYQVYSVTTQSVCDNCGNVTTVNHYEEHVFSRCLGY